jgi:hypothetical protein
MKAASRKLNLEATRAGVRITTFKYQPGSMHGDVADEDAELLPGDTVETMLAATSSASAPQRTADCIAADLRAQPAAFERQGDVGARDGADPCLRRSSWLDSRTFSR